MFSKEYVEAIGIGERIAIPVKDNQVHIFLDSVPSVYNLSLDDYMFPRIIRLRNTEHAEIKVSSLSPLRYEVEGLIYNSPYTHSDRFNDLRMKLWILNRRDYSEEEFNSNVEKMSALLDTIIAEVNPETATRIMCLLDDDIVAKMFDKLPVGSENTLYYTYACALRNKGNRDAQNQENLESELSANATVEFSLNSLDGTFFDIKALRGKWVVLDFWVSWCGPCRRGFELMKKLYAVNSDKMEVVAIACGDQTDVWQNLVSDLQLPWTNLLAPSPESKDGTVGGFPIPAYPTKIIIDPEGCIRDYMVGEDEEFYEKLEKMIKNLK